MHLNSLTYIVEFSFVLLSFVSIFYTFFEIDYILNLESPDQHQNQSDCPKNMFFMILSSNMRIVGIVPTDNHYHTRQRKFLLWNVFKNNNAFYRHSVASNFTVTRTQSAINFFNVCKPSLQLLQRMFLITCIVQAINDIDNGLNFFKRTCPTL